MKKLLVMILALSLLAGAGCGARDPVPQPTGHFDIDHSARIILGETEGASELITFTGVSAAFADRLNSAYPTELKLDAVLAHPADADPTLTTFVRYDIISGTVERKDPEGEWEELGDLEFYTNRQLGRQSPSLSLSSGFPSLYCNFPISVAGEYRISLDFLYGGTQANDDPEIYSVSTTLTVTASEKQFDLLSTEGAFVLNGNVMLLFRANDGQIPYQDLSATRLEKYVRGEWVEREGMVGLLQDPGNIGRDDYISPSGFAATHPFTDEDIDGLFCGAAALHPDDKTASWRLTLEFAENADGSGERYVVQVPISFAS